MLPVPAKDGTEPVTRTRQRIMCLNHNHISSDRLEKPNTAPKRSWGGNSATRVMKQASETLVRLFLGGMMAGLDLK